MRLNIPGLKILYPVKCLVCGKVLWHDEHGVCDTCSDRLPYIRGDRCMICSKPVSKDEVYCRDCARTSHGYECGYAMWSYNRITEGIVADIKYRRSLSGIEFMVSELVYRSADLIRLWNVNAVVPVPLHRKKLKQRGFNQAGIIGEHYAAKLGICYIDDVLYRIRYTMPQKLFDDTGRKNNLQGAFRVDEEKLASYGKAENVVLVDDIYTSGSTINECSMALKEAGVKKVYFVCLCIGDGY